MERPQIREFEYVVALAEESSFTRAAASLGIAQPPLSRAISRLERRLGVRLFERTSRLVVPTERGAEFVERARAVLRAVDELVRLTQSDDLIVAVRPATGSGLLAAVLRSLPPSADRATVRIRFTATPDDDVRRGTADVALMCSTQDTRGLVTDHLIEQPTVVLLPSAAIRGLRAAVTLDDVRSRPGFIEECPDINLDEIVDRVALQGMSMLASADVADRIGSAVAAVPVVDAPWTQLLIASRPVGRTTLHDSFVLAAHRAADRYQRSALGSVEVDGWAGQPSDASRQS